MKSTKCAVIGVGYLGKFHAEKYTAIPGVELVAICDLDTEVSNTIANTHKAQAVTDYHTLLDQVDAVSIVTPTSSHHTIAKDFLEHGVHVLLEKPITTTVEEAEELIKIANTNNCVFQIGHLERFNPVLLALEKVLDGPLFIESVRLAPYKPRGTDVNVVLDLMIHDIDIIQNIVGSPITQIHANGAPVLSERTDIANARIQFENGCVANVTASRVSFKSERKMRIFQRSAYLAIDLQDKKLAIHRKGENEMFPGIPDIQSEEQAFENSDALHDEIVAFTNSIRHGTPPVVSGEDGKCALATATEITRLVRSQAEALFADV